MIKMKKLKTTSIIDLMYKSSIHTVFKQYTSLNRAMSTSIKRQIYPSEVDGPIERVMITKIVENLKPSLLKVSNDSAKHAHHAGVRNATNKTESHFTMEIVSDEFIGKSMPSRHRIVYQILDDEFKTKGLHALTMKTKTVEESNKQANK